MSATFYIKASPRRLYINGSKQLPSLTALRTQHLTHSTHSQHISSAPKIQTARPKMKLIFLAFSLTLAMFAVIEGSVVTSDTTKKVAEDVRTGKRCNYRGTFTKNSITSLCTCPESTRSRSVANSSTPLRYFKCFDRLARRNCRPSPRSDFERISRLCCKASGGTLKTALFGSKACSF